MAPLTMTLVFWALCTALGWLLGVLVGAHVASRRQAPGKGRARKNKLAARLGEE